MEGWRDQEARNEAAARDRNEWIKGEDQRFAGLTLHTFVCECGDSTCEDPIKLTLDQYEAVRAYATRFALALHHENPEAEYVVSETAEFAVVEKFDEPYRRIVRDTDPRR
jgi:anti-anti-sigma regulatory factor